MVKRKGTIEETTMYKTLHKSY